uniref:Uncharacterized protein n=1 Tax=Nicotiana tabacum TaxID=4097 RepID=A0A1S4AU88_TOBAC|nr:PREDICTED: uncharacterized protein LOC107801337 [Nicotiana tabacum]
MKVTNNVKLEIGDVEGNLNSAAYKVKASEMTNTWQEKGYTLIDAQCSKLGNPYFIVSMQPTYVSRNFRLDIPGNFFGRYFKEKETIVILRALMGELGMQGALSNQIVRGSAHQVGENLH